MSKGDKYNETMSKLSATITEAMLDGKPNPELKEIQSMKDKIINLVCNKGENGIIALSLANHELSFKKRKAVG